MYYVFAKKNDKLTLIGKGETQAEARVIAMTAPKNQNYWLVSKASQPELMGYDGSVFAIWRDRYGTWTEHRHGVWSINKDGTPRKKRIYWGYEYDNRY